MRAVGKRIRLEQLARQRGSDPASLLDAVSVAGLTLDEIFDWGTPWLETARDRLSTDFPRLPMREAYDPETGYRGFREFSKAGTARSLGRCYVCGARAEVGRARCASCSKALNAYLRRTYHHSRARGECVQCAGRALDGHAYCAKHAAYYRERGREAYHGRVARGECVDCGRRMEDAAGLTCEACLAVGRVRYHMRARATRRLRADAASDEGQGALTPLSASLDDAPRPRHRRMLAVVDEGQAKLLVYARVGERDACAVDGEH